MSDNKGNIVVSLPNKLVPEDVIKKLFAKSNVLGMALGQKVDGHDEVVQSLARLEGMDLDYEATQKSFKEFPVATFVGEFKLPINEDDIPPFPLFDNARGKPAAVAFVLGNFPGQAEPKSTHSPEWMFTAKILRPQLIKVYESVSKDISKFFDFITEDQLFTAGLQTLAGKDHFILVVGENNRHRTFMNMKEFKAFDWGWAADGTGFDVKEAAPIITQTKRGLFATKSTAVEKPTPVAETKTDTAPPPTVEDGFVLTTIPDWAAGSNGKRKDWLERHGIDDAKRPKNWKENDCVFKIRLGTLSVKDKEWIKSHNSGKLEVVSVTASDPVITSTTTIIPDEEAPDNYVTDKQISALHAEFVQASGTAKVITDPDQFQKQERERQHFKDLKLGPIEVIAGWSKDRVESFIIQYPESAVIAFMDLRAMAGLTPDQVKETPAEPDKKVEPAPAARKGIFASRAA